VLGCTLGISANTDSIRQAKGIQTPIPLKQTNKHPESSENMPILLQEADLCFSKQNDPRNPKMCSKQSFVVATQ
jgi:hypothetical protein